jgi:hypothetical protein
VRYDIVNLSFTGKLFTEYPLPDGGYRRSFDTLSLNLGGRSVSVVLVRDARSVLNRIRATKGIGVTARVQTTIHELSDLEAVDLDIGRLCSLLTLATGSKIVWTARETRAASERLDLTVRSAVTRSISEAPLIDTDDPDTLRHFLEATLRPYVEFEVTYELARVIDARVDGISGGFLETRTLMLGVLADYLTGRFSHVHQVGFGSFEEHLRNMVKHVCPDVRGKDIRKFVNTRDMLAHEMRFRTADKVAEFRHALHVVNRLLLGVLAYHGPYVDCRTWTVVTPPSDTPTQQAKNS